MSESKQVQIAPQAALNEYAALVDYYRNRNLQLAQAIHELSGTVEVLNAELASVQSALDAELNKESA
ncbi:hypothetical protein N8E89_09345 [Phyllobacterium sp. A18/5-2]|uniref:hypothetical protein n=1 Tax=Phyllobacterium sp. A18/5-2 TaxID=2978392 RepID=UPI0021C7E69A|nr:hypothetical protein [Phyllobacterium sp. A18/5-2]UXN62920.1 hypothetical protein N8E89_09345 [Phyllobacterium sp. A18/5-2]